MTWLLLTADVSVLSWVWLTLFQGLFWRTDLRLPPLRPALRPATEAGSRRKERPRTGSETCRADPSPMWPPVVVVVPARNEAAILPTSLPTLLAQRYPGHARVILVDDNSDDGTGELAKRLAATHGGLALTVTTPGEPEPGWTGKLWAVHHGLQLVGTDQAEYVLLTDADIAHGTESLTQLVSSAVTRGYDLVSLMAKLRVETRWERLIVPAFVYFFAQLYPFRRVNEPSSRTAAAAGGCSLVRFSTLKLAGGLESIRHAVIDDVALARMVKRQGGRIWLGLAEQVKSVRPYPRLGELWQMVSRSAYAQLHHNVALLMATVAALTVVYLVPPVAVAVGAVTSHRWMWAAGAVAWALMAGTFVPMLRYYRLPPWSAPLLPFTAALYLLMTVDSAVRHHQGRGAAWKGRTYPAPARGDIPPAS